ncbi:mitochondrial fission process protein 1-like [Mizuhopecten yessoensis]|uniref:Mitochondrial fission process protein 1 n=1 Tax=Mizuhopecten yessoensis TaxID=6573 RepID=A0A210PVB5_MIZYE|nr:mitochondrial fission process protein 1-like [Mizuhopecten yessoensis]OWF40402.1 Mitochondrial fission process protein 1 [Mizuhopecten yessoensis]
MDGNKEGGDIFRDTPVRYLGYANEVGESFRAQIHVNAVRFSYAIASGYVVADAVHKGKEASLKTWKNEGQKSSQVRWAIFDTLMWQGLASVAIPGFTINRICALSAYALKKNSQLPGKTRKWITTIIGLACIPFIIKPIDLSVDALMENTVRKWYHIGPVMETVVHHDRND